jgi:hypothetical protein
LVHPPSTTPWEDHGFLRSGAVSSNSQHRNKRSLQAPLSDCPNPSPADIRDIFVVSQPNPIGITVDGLTDDWDLSTAGYDYVTDLYNAGEADPDTQANNYQVVGKLYLRWNCLDRRLCALVLADEGYCTSGQNNEFKDYGLGITLNGLVNVDSPTLPGKYVGWEGALSGAGIRSLLRCTPNDVVLMPYYIVCFPLLQRASAVPRTCRRRRTCAAPVRAEARTGCSSMRNGEIAPEGP